MLSSVSKILINFFISFSLDVEHLQEQVRLIFTITPFFVPWMELVVSKVECPVGDEDVVFFKDSVRDNFPLSIVGLSHFLYKSIKLCYHKITYPLVKPYFFYTSSSLVNTLRLYFVFLRGVLASMHGFSPFCCYLSLVMYCAMICFSSS